MAGNFEIEWNGEILGYWIDMQGDFEIRSATDVPNVSIYDIPQIAIQELLLGEHTVANYIPMSDKAFISEEEQIQKIVEREKKLKREIQAIQEGKKAQKQEDLIKNGKTEETMEGVDTSANVKKEINESTKEKIESKQIDSGIRSTYSDDFKISEHKALEDARVLIGTDKMSNKIYWEFGHSQLANRHMLITGTSGQGKTYSIQTMLYELSKINVSAIVFDYTEGFRPDQLEKNFLEKMGERVKQHVIYYTGVPINPFKRHEIEVAGLSMKEKASDVAARIANIFKHVNNFGDQQFSAIFEAARKGLEKYGDQMNMQFFQEMLEEEKNYNKTAQTVLAKLSPFFHSIEFNENQEFDWGNILYPDKAELNIFQLTSIDREMQVAITELMLWDAWYYTKKVGNKNTPFVTILDEAQNLSHKANSPSAAILTEGRKFGWSAWFATQSLKVLADDEVVRLLQAATKLYFKPTDDEILKMAKQLDPSDSNRWLSALKNLKKGQCIVVGSRTGANGEFGGTKPTITTVTSFEERN